MTRVTTKETMLGAADQTMLIWIVANILPVTDKDYGRNLIYLFLHIVEYRQSTGLFHCQYYSRIKRLLYNDVGKQLEIISFGSSRTRGKSASGSNDYVCLSLPISQ